MRLSLKQKQVLGVTAMVALIVIALSLLHLINTAGVLLAESRDRFELFGSAVYSQARERDHHRRETAYNDVRTSRYVQSALQVGAVFAGRRRCLHRRSDRHRDRLERSGAGRARPSPRRPQLNDVIAMNGVTQAARDLRDRRSTLEWTQPMALGDTPFGEIRIGLSTVLVQRDLNQSLTPAAVAAGIALLIAVLHRDAAGAAGAAADARDPQQPVEARPRRSRRHARSAGRRGVSRAG